MNLRRRFFVGAVMVGIFALGVGVALAGFPNFKAADGTFTTTTTTTKRNAPALTSVRLSARTTAPPGGGTSVCGLVTVNYTAVGPTGKYEFLVTAAVAKIWWAVFNNGGQVPNDGSTQKAPQPAEDFLGTGVNFIGKNGKVSGTVDVLICPPDTIVFKPGAGQYVGLAYLYLGDLTIQAKNVDTGELGPTTDVAVPAAAQPYCDPGAAAAIPEPDC